MSMTEQEIRADERKKVATALTVLQPFLKDAESVGVSFAIKFLTGVRPEPEPKVTVKWYDYNWNGHHWNVKPVKVAAPPKDWRDVPVTAGMIADAFKPCAANPLGQGPRWAESLEWAAKRKTELEATLAEASQKGWP